MMPQRSECIIPEKMKDSYPILRELRVPTIRALYTLMPPENASVKASSSTQSADVIDQVAGPTKVASSKQILKCNFSSLDPPFSR